MSPAVPWRDLNDAHSVHVDRLAGMHLAIARALEAGAPARVEAAEHAKDVIDELVRDEMADLWMVVSKVQTGAWDELEAPEVSTGRKREISGTATGQPIVTIDYVREA